MGTKVSKINVLVLGLANAGKTHFIDLVYLGEDTTKSPTFGYHEGSITYENKTRVNLIEYGFKTPWSSLYHDIDVIYVLLRMNFTMEQVLETKSIILKMTQQIPDVPLCIIYSGPLNGKKQQKMKKLLQLDVLKKDVNKVAEVSLDLDDKKTWKEGLSRLLEWTIDAHGKNVQNK